MNQLQDLIQVKKLLRGLQVRCACLFANLYAKPYIVTAEDIACSILDHGWLRHGHCRSPVESSVAVDLVH